MSNIISLHRHIQQRSARAVERENQQLRAMISQRDAALLAIITRVGPQTFTGEELAAVPQDSEVLCEPKDDTVTFSVVGVEDCGVVKPGITPAS